MIEFVDPRAEPEMAIEGYTLSVDPNEGPVSIGLLANGFPDSVAFLDRVEAAMRQKLPRLQHQGGILPRQRQRGIHRQSTTRRKGPTGPAVPRPP